MNLLLPQGSREGGARRRGCGTGTPGPQALAKPPAQHGSTRRSGQWGSSWEHTGLAAQIRQCRASSLLHPTMPTTTGSTGGTGCTGPGWALLPLGSRPTPCARLDAMVPTRGLSKQEVCPAALSPVGHPGLLPGAVRQERGHPDAPSP